MRHYPSVTTIVTPQVTAATTKERTSFSIEDPTNFSLGLHGYIYILESFIRSIRCMSVQDS